MTSDRGRVLLYDGECASCNRALRFLDARLPRETQLRYVSSSSADGQVLTRAYPNLARRDALVLIADGRVRQGAAAIQALLRLLPGWRWLADLVAVLPSSLTERGYDLFAANRHRWNRRLTQCELVSDRLIG